MTPSEARSFGRRLRGPDGQGDENGHGAAERHRRWLEQIGR